MVYCPGLIPVGWMYPSFQASRTQANNKMETPTRAANARAIFWDASGPLRPPRIMKNRATPRLPRIVTKAMITRYVIDGIIR